MGTSATDTGTAATTAASVDATLNQEMAQTLFYAGSKTVDDAAKATTDNVAADNAAADKNAADKKSADATGEPLRDAATGKFLPKYDLKLPADSTVDKAVVERTAARARELGLSNEHAQKALDLVHQEVSAAAKAAADATIAAYAPGGAKWEENVKEWNAAALADPELGANKPEQLTQNAQLAKQVVAKFGDKESIEFMKTNPLGSHPALLRMLVRIGKASGEGSLVVPGAQGSPSAPIEKRWYGDSEKAE